MLSQYLTYSYENIVIRLIVEMSHHIVIRFIVIRNFYFKKYEGESSYLLFRVRVFHFQCAALE